MRYVTHKKAATAALLFFGTALFCETGFADTNSIGRTAEENYVEIDTPVVAGKSPHGETDIDCQVCHTTSSWKMPAAGVGFQHDRDTDFALDGHHRSADCSSCHAGMVFRIEQRECFDCHVDAHQSELGFDCAGCHEPESWQPLGFYDQHALTRFALVGQHTTTDCQSCHVNQQEGEFAGLSTDCMDCHIDAYLSASEPAHAANNISTTCDRCHTSDGWPTTTIEDHAQFGFVLDGAHRSIESDCLSCHVNRSYSTTSSECAACHLQAYETSVDPDHLAGQLPTDCDQCHTTDPGWVPATFDHGLSSFPLTGAHLTIENDCMSCHTTGFTGTDTDCYGCHQEEFETAANPNHVANQFPLACESCHTTLPGWSPAVFDHSETDFQMTGGHLLVENECDACHADGFNNTPNECFACHESDYQETADPDHAANGFPTDCEICHSTAPGWTPALFDHSQTGFPLTGAHLTIESQCVLCHAGGVFTNTPTDCYACHEPAYSASTDPDHSGLEFPTACETCHNTSAWVPSLFDHTAFTGYQLLGAHQTISNECAQCHTGNLTSATTDCFDCHLDDYNNAADPNHAGNGFPTDCQECHTQIAWFPSTFDHDGQYFPIYSGRHAGEWTGCGGGSGDGAGCHTTPNIMEFSCIHCHDHNQVDMDVEHLGVSGYVYNSQACFSCHEDGEARHSKFQFMD